MRDRHVWNNPFHTLVTIMFANSVQDGVLFLLPLMHGAANTVPVRAFSKPLKALYASL